MPVKPIPDGYTTVTPYLIVKGADQAMKWYAKAFGAEERFRMPGPDGKTVMHAELTIGTAIVMLADEFPDMGALSPQTLKGTATSFLLYVTDADASFQRAVDAGARVVKPMADQFWGDRYGMVEDPFGHRWSIATHVKDVSPEEMEKAMKAMPPPGAKDKGAKKPKK